MKPLFLTALISLLPAASWSAQKIKLQILPPNPVQMVSCNPDPGDCRIEDQSGSSEPWECRDSRGKIRCYADVSYENGTRMRVWGSCHDSYSDCWSTGDGAVEPCDD